jgi:hypothetical protein
VNAIPNTIVCEVNTILFSTVFRSLLSQAYSSHNNKIVLESVKLGCEANIILVSRPAGRPQMRTKEGSP